MPRSRAPSPRSNRTDTLSPAPVTAAAGQGYGVAAEQRAAQGAIPIANGPTMPAAQAPGAPASSGAVVTAPQGAPGPNDLMAMLQAHNGPGDSMNLMRPTERPNEPVTHGLPVGPGAGPEALTGVGAAARENAMGQATLSQLLSTLAGKPGAPSAIQNLASLAQGGTQ